MMTTAATNRARRQTKAWKWEPFFANFVRTPRGASVVYGVRVGRLTFQTHRAFWVGTTTPFTGFYK